VPAKLRALALNNYTIIISSNQGRLTDLEGNEVLEAASFKRKLEHIMCALQIPVTLLVACANDLNRKPRPGLWPLIPTLTGNDGCGLDKEQSLIVGDAAGREGDFSDSDLNWAMNAEIPFSTPEEFFLGEARKARSHKFDPQWYLDGNEKKECEGEWEYNNFETYSDLISSGYFTVAKHVDDRSCWASGSRKDHVLSPFPSRSWI
jgi:bifunctional polynucleotide phosphatase/kinase